MIKKANGQIRAEVDLEYRKMYMEMIKKTNFTYKELVKLMVKKTYNAFFIYDEKMSDINQLLEKFKRGVHVLIQLLSMHTDKINDSFISTLDNLNKNQGMLRRLVNSSFFIARSLSKLILALTHLFVEKHPLENSFIKDCLDKSNKNFRAFLSKLLNNCDSNTEELINKLLKQNFLYIYPKLTSTLV
jgi:hypothetical protein